MKTAGAIKDRDTLDEVTLESYEGYMAAAKRHKELVSQLEGAERQLEQLALELQRELEGSGELLNQRVQTVVANPAAARSITIKKFAEERRDLDEQARVLRKAIEVQRQAVSMQATIASREAAKTLGAEYRNLVRRIAKSVAELQRATLAENSFRDELAAKGFKISAMFNVTPFLALDDFFPKDPNNALAVYLRECVAAGYVDSKEEF